MLILNAEDAVTATASHTQLVLAALLGIAVIVLLIVWLKVHPFLSLMFGSLALAVAAGIPYTSAFDSFTSGFGSTEGNVGILIVLGAIIGKLLIDSGGADQIVDTILAKTKVQMLPWAMALAAFIIGIPLFFEVGVVLLIPIVMIVAKRTHLPVMLVGISALAGLSVLHALVPPHPGPLIAISALNADLGRTLGYGLIIAVPTVIISGPLLAKVMARWVPLMAPDTFLGSQERDPEAPRPSFATALLVVLLPVILMLGRTVVETTGNDQTAWGRALYWIGTPLEALVVTTVVAIFALGILRGRSREDVERLVGAAFGPIASVLLIVGAGGGFKQTLVDSGVGDVMASMIEGASISPLLAGWVVAALIRLAAGSSTVATITAAGIMAPVAEAGMSSSHVALLVLAIGAGSVFLSHVNDAGFWLVKEYFGLTVGETFKTWSLMEVAVSVVGLGGVMALSLVV